MPGVMDIQHLLCQPSSPSPPPALLNSNSSTSSSTSSNASSPSSCSADDFPYDREAHHMLDKPMHDFIYHQDYYYNNGHPTMMEPTTLRLRQCHPQQKRQEPTPSPSPPQSLRSFTPGTNVLRMPWTPAEDALLDRGYHEGLSWAMIASIYLPHRSRGCCWGRYKILQSRQSSRLSH
ncbi:hypothetical protein BCR43DRAFT_520789 [Syncephalastrum racemosum]|uniref:Myb-like domain-containing protein n=1 Tax=Syncephalastrum racemosum TaxID=13706 RepID=A0A1X2HVV3_SYNRA|nr:hypothetical protein BCR43DRAFT_520789 [Syncephalastrum racemosum]